MTSLAPLYHGGVSGLRAGDLLTPSPPHVFDGCPICVARAEGRAYTVGEYREVARRLGPHGRVILAYLEGAPDHMPVDPPSGTKSVYVTSDLAYARWYAARSRGDLYRVDPLSDPIPSDEDPFPSFLTDGARVVEVLERSVRLVRRERRELMRRWEKADRRKVVSA